MSLIRSDKNRKEGPWFLILPVSPGSSNCHMTDRCLSFDRCQVFWKLAASSCPKSCRSVTASRSWSLLATSTSATLLESKEPSTCWIISQLSSRLGFYIFPCPKFVSVLESQYYKVRANMDIWFMYTYMSYINTFYFNL